MKTLLSVVGARPNFIKMAPFHHEIRKHPAHFRHLICHTGQHFDGNMSDVFFKELEIPHPDFNLNIGSGSHAEQTAKIMIAFEKLVSQIRPDLVVVYGDVNSTMACSLVAAKMGIRIAHVEAGLRSFDKTMPEEINRMITDVLSDFLFVSEKSGLTNLANEGVPGSKVFFTGNIMIDSLVRNLKKVDSSTVYKDLNLTRSDYIVITFHRPSNVDDGIKLKEIAGLLTRLSHTSQIVFPIHPRTKANLLKHGILLEDNPDIKLLDPIGYFDFISLVKNSCLVITDSGGIQEETTFLKVPCLTLRHNTERPSTMEEGTNQLIGFDLEKAEKLANEIISKKTLISRIPEKWDGHTAERIVEVLVEQLI
jgi:UDP-N-acetylglucosamine 2-epimerase (non-hydrolysing)